MRTAATTGKGPAIEALGRALRGSFFRFSIDCRKTAAPQPRRSLGPLAPTPTQELAARKTSADEAADED
jgi:hypothetical protein